MRIFFNWRNIGRFSSLSLNRKCLTRRSKISVEDPVGIFLLRQGLHRYCASYGRSFYKNLYWLYPAENKVLTECPVRIFLRNFSFVPTSILYYLLFSAARFESDRVPLFRNVAHFNHLEIRAIGIMPYLVSKIHYVPLPEFQLIMNVHCSSMTKTHRVPSRNQTDYSLSNHCP